MLTWLRLCSAWFYMVFGSGKLALLLSLFCLRLESDFLRPLRSSLSSSSVKSYSLIVWIEPYIGSPPPEFLLSTLFSFFSVRSDSLLALSLTGDFAYLLLLCSLICLFLTGEDDFLRFVLLWTRIEIEWSGNISAEPILTVSSFEYWSPLLLLIGKLWSRWSLRFFSLLRSRFIYLFRSWIVSFLEASRPTELLTWCKRLSEKSLLNPYDVISD